MSWKIGQLDLNYVSRVLTLGESPKKYKRIDKKKTFFGRIRTRVIWEKDFWPAPLPTELLLPFPKRWLISHYIGVGNKNALSISYVNVNSINSICASQTVTLALLWWFLFVQFRTAKCNCPKAHKQTTLISVPFTKTNDDEKKNAGWPHHQAHSRVPEVTSVNEPSSSGLV